MSGYAGQPFPQPGANAGSWWLVNAITAVGYFTLAVAVHKLAPLFGQPALFWPAAGFALFAILKFGSRCWPALAVATLFAGGLDPWPPEPARYGIALGVVLQALVGARLVRESISIAEGVQGDWQVARNLLLAGPVACLVSSSIGVSSRLLSGLIAPEDMVSHWLAWWCGDSLGVFIAMPLLTYPWSGAVKSGPRWGVRVMLPTLLIAGVLLYGHFDLRQQHQKTQAGEIVRAVDTVAARHDEHVLRGLLLLQIVGRVFAANDEVSAEGFAIFSTPVVRSSPLAFIDYAPRVQQDRLGSFVARMRRDKPGYAITELRPNDARPEGRDQEDYFPVAFAFPLSPELSVDDVSQILGLDHASSAVRRVAMDKARQGNSLTVAYDQILRLDWRPGYLAFQPVFESDPGDPTAAGAARHEQLQGFIVGLLPIETLIEPLQVSARKANLMLRIRDVSDPAAAIPLLDEIPDGAAPVLSRRIALADRTWEMSFMASDALTPWGRSHIHYLYLVASVLTIGLAVFAMMGAVNRNAYLERGVQERTAELGQAVKALGKARSEADAANKAKSAFLATMSHEIRTPMNGVIGLLDVMKSTTLSDYQRDLLETMERSGQILLRLIDDILDYSKIEAGRLSLEQVPIALPTLTEGLCDSLTASARDRQVDLLAFVDPALPARVLGDETRLRQLLFNLVGNAVKFSSGLDRRGKVCLRIEPATRSPYTVAVQISDNGIGMTAQARKQLFRPFLQAESSTTRRFGGTGLGLAVCKRLVEMMHGRIEVHSELGKGARFEVLLPLKAIEAAVPPTDSLAGVTCVLVGELVLPPADLRRYLEYAGAAVETASSIEAAALRLRQFDNVVVIYDARGQEPDLEHLREIFSASELRRHFALTRGLRRSPRRSASGVVTLDIRGLRQATLLSGVAIAAGLEDPPEPPRGQRGAGSGVEAVSATATHGAFGDDSLRGLRCVIVGAARAALASSEQALRDAGVRLEYVDSLAQAADLVSPAADQPAVIVQDVPDGAVSFDLLHATFPRHRHLGHVALTRGQRKSPRFAVQEFVSLDANQMDTRALWTAIAEASGFLSPRTTEISKLLGDESAGSLRQQESDNGRRILVAEDDSTNRKVIRAQLEMLGLSCELATDGHEALQRWRAGQFDLLLADLHMPRLDGYELTRTIRAEEGDDAHLPIIALTANAMQGESRRARDAGMDGYLLKPVKVDVLRNTLEQWLPAAVVPEAEGASPGAEIPVLDVTILKGLVGGDPAMIRDLLRDFRANAKGHVSQINQAWQREDLAAVGETAHKLKSSARTVGALPVGALSEELEHEAKSGAVQSVAAIMPRLNEAYRQLDAALEQELRA